MIFSDLSDRNGLIQECERISTLGATKISGNTNLLKDFTARINMGIDRFYALVFEYDLNWNYDDKNQTDLPIAVTSLVSGQQDYQFASELLSITQAFVKDSGGTFHEITEQDDKNSPNTFLLSVNSGVPLTYKLVSNSILLSPIPNYASSGGLKVIFRRNGVKFDYTNVTAVPGIPSLFHGFLARFASYPYLLEKGIKTANNVALEIAKDEMAIKAFISNRAKPKRFGLRTVQQNNR